MLIADDIEIVRNGYAILFAKSNSIEICATAKGGEEVLQLYPEVKPDVILMDIVMPDKDGIRTSKELLLQYEDAKIILNTASLREDIINRVLPSGAKGLLLKDADYTEIEKAITSVYNGFEYYNKNVLDILVRRLLKSNTESLREYWGNQFEDRDLDIIQLTSQGLTSTEIGKQLNLSKRTIEVSRAAIFKRMKVNSVTEMIVMAYKMGLLDINRDADAA